MITQPTLALLDDNTIDHYGLRLEEQIGDLLSTCMADPPFNLNWPKLLSDVAADAPASASAQGNWRRMRQLSKDHGGGTLVWYDQEKNEPVGYAHCVVVTPDIITEFRLDDPCLEDCAWPGDLLLTFAGLARTHRGVRILEDGKVVFPPFDGWLDGQVRPGIGMYNMLYTTRIERWGQGRRIWNRTHPNCVAVMETARKCGLIRRGQFEVSQGGSMTPKVVLSTPMPT